MSTIKLFSKAKIKQTFTYSTIAIASICALIGIIMIFAGPQVALFQLLSTIFIFYLITLISIPSIRRLDDRSLLIRTLSVVALIMNAFWAIPWVLLVWDAFSGSDYKTRDTIWRLLWTAADIAIFCAIIASQLARIRWSNSLQKFFQSLPIVCAAFIALDIIIAIWVPEDGAELLLKFICTEVILIVLQVIVTQLLNQKRRQEEAHAHMIQEVRSQGNAVAQPTAESQSSENPSDSTPKSA